MKCRVLTCVNKGLHVLMCVTMYDILPNLKNFTIKITILQLARLSQPNFFGLFPIFRAGSPLARGLLENFQPDPSLTNTVLTQKYNYVNVINSF